MISLRRLEKLPPSQCLRKIAKIAGEAEQHLLSAGVPAASAEAAFVSGALKFLLRAETFSPALRNALLEAAAVLSAPSPGGSSRVIQDMRRALNAVRRLLMAETGNYPADWDFDAAGAGGGLDPLKRRVFPGMQVYLEDIRSPFNVGAMFRAAESFGVEKIWLSPLCADPMHPRSQRTAMGCVEVLPWERLPAEPFSSGSSAAFNCPVFALETGGALLDSFSFPKAALIVIGSEELGVSPAALAAAGISAGRVTIPIYGAKGSLNVSTAFGIVMQKWAEYLAKTN
jgi:TrmH family RNA methyltransferase